MGSVARTLRLNGKPQSLSLDDYYFVCCSPFQLWCFTCCHSIAGPLLLSSFVFSFIFFRESHRFVIAGRSNYSQSSRYNLGSLLDIMIIDRGQISAQLYFRSRTCVTQPDIRVDVDAFLLGTQPLNENEYLMS